MANILDIIIPIYNTPEKYLVRALNSINRQKNVNFKEINVVVIDNASKEIKYKRSWFKQRFPKLNITFIVNKENLGPGLSRQVGIDNSCGKYITFLDSDDELYGDYTFAKALTCLEEFDVDRLNSAVVEEIMGEDNQIHEVKHGLNKLSSLHSLFVKREFLLKYNIRFHEKLRYHEDFYYDRLVYGLSCNSKAYLDEVTYLWKWNGSSVMRGNQLKYKYLDSEIIAITDSNKILEKYNVDNYAMYVSGMCRFFVILASNILKEANAEESREKYEKMFYEDYFEHKDVFDNLEEDYINRTVERRLDDMHRSSPWIEIKESFESFVSRLEKAYGNK